MDTDVQKNAADIADLDKRMSSHEAMCEERWKTCFNRFDDMDSSISRIESILSKVKPQKLAYTLPPSIPLLLLKEGNIALVKDEKQVKLVIVKSSCK